MAQELKGLVAGLAAGLFVVGASFGVSAIVTHGQPTETRQAPPRQTSAVAGNPPATQLVAQGHGLYLQACVGCHGQDAQGQIGPTLHHIGDPDAKITRSIANGFPPRMPAYKNKLSAAQIQALTAYVQSLE